MTNAYVLGTLIASAAIVGGCSSSSVPPPTPVPGAVASVSVAFVQTPVVTTGTAATFPLSIRAFAADGTEISGKYLQSVTVTLNAACDFGIGAAGSAIDYIDPAVTGSTMCPNVSSTAPAPSVVVTASGANVAVGYNGGFVPSPVTVTASVPGIAADTIQVP